ncbi:acylphosphatase [Candidatus Margulisiibacteriota bacterium]
MKQVHLFISGVVQGVCFRYFAQEKAELLGLTGFARNLIDGRVEVVAEGPEKQLRILVDLMKKGPDLARVSDVAESWSEASNKREGFNING